MVDEHADTSMVDEHADTLGKAGEEEVGSRGEPWRPHWEGTVDLRQLLLPSSARYPVEHTPDKSKHDDTYLLSYVD